MQEGGSLGTGSGTPGLPWCEIVACCGDWESSCPIGASSKGAPGTWQRQQAGRRVGRLMYCLFYLNPDLITNNVTKWAEVIMRHRLITVAIQKFQHTHSKRWVARSNKRHLCIRDGWFICQAGQEWSSSWSCSVCLTGRTMQYCSFCNVKRTHVCVWAEFEHSIVYMIPFQKHKEKQGL